jgi:hypothetical protein
MAASQAREFSHQLGHGLPLFLSAVHDATDKSSFVIAFAWQTLSAQR